MLMKTSQIVGAADPIPRAPPLGGLVLAALLEPVDLEYAGLAAQLHALLLEDRQQLLLERLALLARVPDLADLEVPVVAEADVVVEPVRHPVGGRLDLLRDPVVGLLGQSLGLE